MAYERREFPEWSWSYSRRGTFQECPRKYYYHYYGSHNGWEDDADPLTTSAYRLKQLTNLFMETGGAIHSAAAFAVQSARTRDNVPGSDALHDMVRNQLNQAYVESKDRDEWERSPRRRKMFHEFYYDTGLSETAIEQSKERIRDCLTNLVESESFREANAAPYVEVKEVEGFVTFDVEDTRVHAVPDLVYRLGDDTWTVTDWKTGREDVDWEQVGVYALYVQSRHGIEAQKIRGRIEWLAHGSADEHWFSEDELAGTRGRVVDSIAAMRGYLEDPNANMPRELEAFPLREDTSVCRFCNFYELDREEIGSRVPGPF